MSDPTRWYPPTGWDGPADGGRVIDPDPAGSDPVAPAVDPPGGRLRIWLTLALLVGITACYCVVWGAYVDSRANDHYRQLAPGESAQLYGLTVRVERIGVIAGFDPGGTTPEPPAPGAAWVEAVVRVEGTSEREYERCQFTLLGPLDRVWEPELTYDDSVVSECGPETGTVSVRLVYQVPAADLDGIRGIVLESDGGIFRDNRVIRP